MIDHVNESDVRMMITGTVKDAEGKNIACAELDVWQVQSTGLYDVQQGAGWRNMRGIFTTNGEGKFEIVTVRPVDYTIPDNGPVGQMLRETGRGMWRPAHIHLHLIRPNWNISRTSDCRARILYTPGFARKHL